MDNVLKYSKYFFSNIIFRELNYIWYFVSYIVFYIIIAIIYNKLPSPSDLFFILNAK